MNAPAEKTLTRTYPVRVEGADGESVAIGKSVTLPIEKTRKLEKRLGLNPVKNPVENNKPK